LTLVRVHRQPAQGWPPQEGNGRKAAQKPTACHPVASGRGGVRCRRRLVCCSDRLSGRMQTVCTGSGSPSGAFAFYGLESPRPALRATFPACGEVTY